MILAIPLKSVVCQTEFNIKKNTQFRMDARLLHKAAHQSPNCRCSRLALKLISGIPVGPEIDVLPEINSPIHTIVPPDHTPERTRRMKKYNNSTLKNWGHIQEVIGIQSPESMGSVRPGIPWKVWESMAPLWIQKSIEVDIVDVTSNYLTES